MAQKLEPAPTPSSLDLDGEGLCALLTLARQLPPRAPCDLSDLDPEPQTGLGKLLTEARRALAAQQHGGR